MYEYKLKIQKYKDVIVKLVKNNNVVVIRAPTGCGKSTYVPLLFKDKKVAVIEPRRIAVMSLYNTLVKSNELNVGYKMRFNIKVPSNSDCFTNIYTDGAFLANLDLDYDVIIIDEVHERSVRTDVLLSILKNKIKEKKFKLILMSATVDVDKITNFFNAHLLDIKMKTFPIEINYLDVPTPDYINQSYLAIKNIIKNYPLDEDRNDILVFLPGSDDIEELYRLVSKIPSILSYKIYSVLSDEEQSKIFESTQIRKVILSTNICETSLTIPSVKYVIDTGLYKVKIFNGISYLGIKSISDESALQRIGRCNRLGPGVVYKLYTKSQKLEQNIPEMVRSDLSTMILLVLSHKIDLMNLDFIDLPRRSQIQSALDILELFKCIKINNNDLTLTSYGRRLSYHPFDVHLANFYEKCIENKIAKYGSILLSMISLENFNFLNSDSKELDIRYLVRIFEEYKNSSNKRKYVIDNNLPSKGMSMALQIYKSLRKNCSVSDENVIEILEKVFSDSFKHNLCVKSNDGSYIHQNTKQKVFIHPSSGYFKRNIRKVVIVDLFYSTKLYMRIVGNYII
ncbi:DHX33 [Hepatospora eriocheir]|uniref:DHX33 n=1 Tax=Hepatospora eriocheir TaxID=1081669 RepID=A0A1X0QI54_9MICR|nr:DHX33 [Hepatospora eriocheir]